MQATGMAHVFLCLKTKNMKSLKNELKIKLFVKSAFTKVKYFALLLLTFSFYNCSPYIQVFDTSSDNIGLDKENSYVLENDSIRVEYNFWEEKGIMSFAVYNKLKKPLYINWHKSSYVQNGNKLNYWEDELITKGTEKTVGRLNYYNFYAQTSINHSITSKPEKVTFIPPNSNYVKRTFHILPIKELIVKNYSSITVPVINHKYKKKKAFQKKFNRSDSPVSFRNFLTLSYDENFKDEFYIDNEFYISQVMKLRKRQFQDKVFIEGKNFSEKDEYGKYIMNCPYKNGKSFYLTIWN